MPAQGGSWARRFGSLLSYEAVALEQSSQQLWGSFSDSALSYSRLAAKVSPPACPLN